MTDDVQLLRLVSAAADGALEPDEREELEKRLPGSAEARQFEAELLRLDELLGSVPPVEPPPDLRQKIFDRIDVQTAPPRRPIFGWLELVFGVPAVRYGIAASAGLLFAVALYESNGNAVSDVDVSQMVGTMAKDRPGQRNEVIDSFSIRDIKVASTATFRRNDEALLLDIQIDAEEPLEVTADLTESGLSMHAIAQFDAPADLIKFSGETLVVRGVGSQSLTVLLRSRDAATNAENAKIGLEFSSNGELLQRGSLATDVN